MSEGIPNPRGIANAPFYDPAAPPRPMQEVWYMKLNAPGAGHALWLRFTLLLQHEGGKRVAEVWAIDFEQTRAAWRKIGLKNTFPIEQFRIATGAASGFCVDACEFSDTHTRGTLRNDAHTIAWDFTMCQGVRAGFDFVPLPLRSLGLIKNEAVNIFEDLRFTGWSEVDGKRFDWTDAPGMQGHLWGARNGHSWAWGHCSQFRDENGAPAALIWDGLTARARRGGDRASRPLSAQYLNVAKRHFCLNRIYDALAIRNNYGDDGWRFHAHGRGIEVEGQILAKRDHFAGVTYEDTDGSRLYCYNSKVSDMDLTLRIEGGAPQRFFARGTTAYEFVMRKPHPEIPLIL